MIGRPTPGAVLGCVTQHRLPRRSANEQARLDAALTNLIEHRISFNPVLGLKLQLQPQRMLGFDMRPDLAGHDHCG